VSDGWRAYSGIGTLGHPYNYTHAVVNHSVEFVNADGDHTNSIEATWRTTKQRIPQKRTTRIIQDHLFERMWRIQNLGRTWTALLDLLREVRFEPQAEPENGGVGNDEAEI
jgi:hypothetical protein